LVLHQQVHRPGLQQKPFMLFLQPSDRQASLVTLALKLQQQFQQTGQWNRAMGEYRQTHLVQDEQT
jgi:hypothetical protein